MPKITVPIEGTYETVTRPVVVDVIARIMQETGIPKDTLILYPNESGKNLQHGSSIDSTFGEPVARFDQQSNIKLTVRETAHEDGVSATAIMRPENVHLFRDDRILTSIRPAYIDTEVELGVEYTAANRNDALQWRQHISSRIREMFNIQSFDITYSYGIPDCMLYILKELHRLREAVAGYGESWEEYFESNSSKRLTTLTNQSGTASLIACKETQTRIVGWYDFDNEPEEGDRKDDGSTWTVSFSYKFRYQKPFICYMQYAYSVHNQIIPKALRPERPVPDDMQVAQYRSRSGNYLAHFEANVAPLAVRDGYSIPAFDDFIPGTVIPHTRRVFTALMTIDTKDPRDMFNLADNGSLVFDPAVLRLLKLEAPFMSGLYTSVFSLTLYRGLNITDKSLFTIDKDLNIRLTFDPDLRDFYHFRLAIVTDWTLLDGKTLDRIRDEAEGVIKVIDTINPGMKDIDLLPGIIGDNYIPKKDLEDAIGDMNTKFPLGNRQIYQTNTVQTLFIESYHADC